MTKGAMQPGKWKEEEAAVFMRRCLQLASLGAGRVAPNPLVGAVLVHNGVIIGEGYHQQYGGPHAEVNCIRSVDPGNRHLIPQSTLFVSLEPCAHFGKTPPCADLVILEQIPEVWVGCRDPFPLVDGKGIEKMRHAGIQVHLGLLEKACRDMNRRFFTFHQKKRPYIILKWACTQDHVMAAAPGEPRLLISNEFSNRLVHQWRSHEAAVLAGSGTVLADDPQLNNRLWPGPSPVRVIIDKPLQLPHSLHVFDGSMRTLVFNTQKQDAAGPVEYYQLAAGNNFLPQLFETLHRLQLQSVLIEPGPSLLQSLLHTAYWDELRVIRSNKVYGKEGLQAPPVTHGNLVSSRQLGSDTIEIYRPA